MRQINSMSGSGHRSDKRPHIQKPSITSQRKNQNVFNVEQIYLRKNAQTIIFSSAKMDIKFFINAIVFIIIIIKIKYKSIFLILFYALLHF